MNQTQKQKNKIDTKQFELGVKHDPDAERTSYEKLLEAH